MPAIATRPSAKLGKMPRSSSSGDGRSGELPIPGDRVEYLESGVFDQMIVGGDVGIVTRVEDGWVFATWPRTDQEHSVPLDHVRLVTAQQSAPSRRSGTRSG